MALTEKAVSSLSPSLRSPINEIEKRTTDELVIALCGAVGSGLSTISTKLCEIFEGFGYTTQVIKITDLINYCPQERNESEFDRIWNLQSECNTLRKDHGHDYLIQKAIKEIANERNEQAAKKTKKPVEDLDSSKDVKTYRKHVTIIDSIKNPAECLLLEKVYRDMFFLFGILCKDSIREDRLVKKGSIDKMTPSQAKTLMERDKIEKEKYGQQVLKTLQYSDFFVRNNSDDTSIIKNSIERFVNLILGKNDITPTIDEYGMHLAEASAKRSGCLSRQVGAAIISEDGDVIATGRNDVPKFGGGLYTEDDQEDCRCLKIVNQTCENDARKEIIYKRIEGIIEKELPSTKEQSFDNEINNIIETIKKDTEIKDLLEYSKAVHAEMDAITTAARIGHTSLKKSTLYTSTFPCHHCTRHIISSGITSVIFIEPYEKSLAKDLHKDSISLDSQSNNNRNALDLKHFEGVAPKRFLSLFHCKERKKDGKLIQVAPKDQKPAISSYLDNFFDYESRVVDIHEDNERSGKKEIQDA